MREFKMVGHCGINCEKCPAYIATISNDEDLKNKTAEQWSEMYQAELKGKDIKCLGCKSEILFSHCNECNIRRCNTENQVETCAHCVNYPCANIEGLHKYLPEEKEFLDGVKKELSEN